MNQSKRIVLNESEFHFFYLKKPPIFFSNNHKSLIVHTSFKLSQLKIFKLHPPGMFENFLTLWLHKLNYLINIKWLTSYAWKLYSNLILLVYLFISFGACHAMFIETTRVRSEPYRNDTKIATSKSYCEK